jgi:WD40 repeat protein
MPGRTDEVIVSRDGSRFAVAGAMAGHRALHWRDAAERTFSVIPGTNDARSAAFSPDGGWIVYATSGEVGDTLLKVSLEGGAPIPLVVPSRETATRIRGVHWGDDETILYGSVLGTFRMPVEGGEPIRIQDSFVHPSLLPGGTQVLGELSSGEVRLLDLETSSSRELIPSGFDPMYLPTGHLVYADASGSLWAVAFDLRRSEVVGDPVRVLDGLSVTTAGQAAYSVSQNGTLIYGVGAERFILVTNWFEELRQRMEG